MPSALETLVKILKLERVQGGNDTAVVGGLSEYCRNWEPEARRQARKPAHQILIDEIMDCLKDYDKIEPESNRKDRLNYILDRITNRIPPPAEYTNRLQTWTEKMAADKPRDSRERRGRDHSDRRQARPPRSRKAGSSSQKQDFRDDDATWDEDYTGGPQSGELDIKPLPRLERPPRIPRAYQSFEEALARYHELDAPTTDVKGIGNKLAESLKTLDLYTIGQLLFSFPRDYLDYTELKCIRDLVPNETTTIVATVSHAGSAIGANQRQDFLIRVTDGSGALSIRFFGQHYLSGRILPGKQIVLNGKVTVYRDRLQMSNPEWEQVDLENLQIVGIVPVYRLGKGMRPRLFRKTMKALSADWAGSLPDPVPQSVLERAELADLGWAMRQRHFPSGWDHLRHAYRRLAFDELLMLQLAVLGNRRKWQSAQIPALAVSNEVLADFIKNAFEFELTADQHTAIADIRKDMSQTVPMNRLVQGDVGSGKTAIAMVAMAIALSNKKQAALMAPTGILAEQHYRKIANAVDAYPGPRRPVVALLTSALNNLEREAVYRGVGDGSIDIVVGTHSLIQEGLDFKQLGIAVIDEQHRFGVGQRAKLRGKGGNPHLLVMTATPIPRTLSLTIYADLDLTLIKEKPPGRRQVITKVIDPIARERLHGFVITQLEQGRQAFFIHPLVEESESVETASATEAFESLQKVFFRYRVCLLHGRMSSAEKDRLMSEFSAGQHDVMVTTSVAEVGVDVPNASVIVIDGANRFGLAQLHQFRGRVGRGEHQSYCFLIPDRSSSINMDRVHDMLEGEALQDLLSVAEKRLVAMAQTNDGFALAELDWQLRGGGDLLGWRQSGKDVLQSLQKFSPELVQLAQREARTIYEEDPSLTLPEHQLLARRISQLFAEQSELS
ncbi:MAG: ATP-dependent DNA helicase RecG [Chloroflexi bacterium]|nr:ATP-dependent DNA helicase RecG [Chloroflexota bacterium]